MESSTDSPVAIAGTTVNVFEYELPDTCEYRTSPWALTWQPTPRI